jgi:hypothetical protein
MPTVSAQELFRDLVQAEIAPMLKTAGWAKSGNNFRLRAVDTIAVIQLAKSPWSRAGHLWFWIKAGVWSNRLSEVEARIGSWGRAGQATPVPDQCHWVMWFDDIMRPSDEWGLHPGSTPAQMAALGGAVRDRLTSIVLPTLTAHLSDEAIRDELLAGYAPLSQSGLAWLYALVEALGPDDELPRIASQLVFQDPFAANRLGASQEVSRG